MFVIQTLTKLLLFLHAVVYAKFKKSSGCYKLKP